MAKSNQAYQNERGSALIIVMFIILVISVLVASAVTISQTANYFSKNVSDRGLSAYYAEGAGARIFWLLLNDKKQNGNPNLISFTKTEEDKVRFLADGSENKIHGYEAEAVARIMDFSTGVDISGKQPENNLKRDDKTFENQAQNIADYQAFIDKVRDYIDRDEFVRNEGAEFSDYEEMNLPHLPRNGPFQFREEIMLIPGCKNYFKADTYGQLSDCQPIPFPGMQASMTEQNNFFSIGPGILLKDGLTKEQVKQVLDIRQQWQNNKERTIQEVLKEQLPPDVMRKLNKYSFQASGFYRFIVKVTPEFSSGSRILIFNVKITSRPGRDKINYYDWQML